MKKFIKELNRRHVIKASLAYLVVSWVLLEVLSILLPLFGVPELVLKGLTLLLVIGLPIWIVISWIYDISPKGIEKTTKDTDDALKTEFTNKRLNVFIIVSLSIIVVVLTINLIFFSSDNDERYAIAVLPFENLNVDEDNDWISKGLAKDIHTYLSKIENLTIISERAVKEAIDSEKTLLEIAKLLNVTHFVGGSISQYENDIKICVHLTRMNDGKDPWAEIYNRNLDNPFKIQQDVSQKIVAQLEVELTPEEEKTLERFPTENMEAYELFTKGRLLNDQKNKQDLELSIDLFEQAILLDPNFAEAYAETAKSYFELKNWAGTNGINIAKEYIAKALMVDPNTARAYAIRGDIFVYEHNWRISNENFKIASALGPNDAMIHNLYATYFAKKPIPDQKMRLHQMRIAHRIDPLDSEILENLILALMYNEKLEEAEKNLNELGFLLSFQIKTNLEIKLEVFKVKDWTAEIRYWEREIEKDPNDFNAYARLSKSYDVILNDKVNKLKYAKIAYELNPTRPILADEYYAALLDNEKFNKAKELCQTKSYGELPDKDRLVNLWLYYYKQENYEKAKEILNDSLAGLDHYFYYEILNYAQLGDSTKVDKFLSDYYSLYGKMDWMHLDMAIAYAILREKDSVYHYLEQLRPIDELRILNSRRDFDPYRKEERFKALLKKHYLPITHWNE